MGKAKILEAHGEGRYTIQVVEARERAELAKRQAQARVAEREADINALNGEITKAGAAVDAAAAEQDAAVAAYRGGARNISVADLSKFAAAVMKAARARDALEARKRALETMKASDKALISRVDSLPPLRQMQAWCADYTEDLSGTVATAEVPGEIGQVVIKPGFEDSNRWSPTEDGAMQPALASTPAGTFYNLAMMPGWQKWRPTFRVATITAISGDSCDIDLDSASSSEQGLGVDAKSSYPGVPILYMDCNGGAFEEGDRVLVAFAGNVDGPTVVGFESEPRSCFTSAYFTPSLEDAGLIEKDVQPNLVYVMSPVISGAGKYVCQLGDVDKTYNKYIATGIKIEEERNTQYSKDFSVKEGFRLGEITPPGGGDITWSNEVGEKKGGATLENCSIDIKLQHSVVFETSASGWTGSNYYPETGYVEIDGACAPGYTLKMIADLSVKNTCGSSVLISIGAQKISVACRINLKAETEVGGIYGRRNNEVSVYEINSSRMDVASVSPEISVNGVISSEGLKTNDSDSRYYRFNTSMPRVRLRSVRGGIRVGVSSDMFKRRSDSASFLIKKDGETIVL